MALYFISLDRIPSYIALSTDIVDNKIDGATAIGKTIYLIDTGEWKIIKEDLTLSDYLLPSS